MTRKILVAEDDPSIRELVTRILRSDPQFHTFTAKDGVEAVRVARQEKPQLVLLDIAMPRANGWQVCQALKRDSNTSDIKVIMVTGLIQDSVRRRALESGADGYVTKPFTPKGLLDAIGQILG